jgi:hypothetical protein
MVCDIRLNCKNDPPAQSCPMVIIMAWLLPPGCSGPVPSRGTPVNIANDCAIGSIRGVIIVACSGHDLFLYWFHQDWLFASAMMIGCAVWWWVVIVVGAYRGSGLLMSMYTFAASD